MDMVFSTKVCLRHVFCIQDDVLLRKEVWRNAYGDYLANSVKAEARILTRPLFPLVRTSMLGVYLRRSV